MSNVCFLVPVLLDCHRYISRDTCQPYHARDDRLCNRAHGTVEAAAVAEETRGKRKLKKNETVDFGRTHNDWIDVPVFCNTSLSGQLDD